MIKRFFAGLVLLPFFVDGQTPEAIHFLENNPDTYYLAVRPLSGQINGVVVLFSSYEALESQLPETKLHNVASANDILSVFANIDNALYPDDTTIRNINDILRDVVSRFHVRRSAFVIAGGGYAGIPVLRYAELSKEHPDVYPVQPAGVFTVGSPVDLVGLTDWCHRIINKNYHRGQVGDATYFLGRLQSRIGSPVAQANEYQKLTPFDARTPGGNEQFLKQVAVRLYYDRDDIGWELKNHRNGFDDTFLPGGSELISRLLLEGNDRAEFIANREGYDSNGERDPSSWSIVDEIECIQWIKKVLDIFDPVAYSPPYKLDNPEDWPTERFGLPIDFAPGIPYKGVEDLRFAPGWGDNTSAEHWSYFFLWWLEGQPKITADSLAKNLKLYYSGLVGRNIVWRKIPVSKQVPTIATVKKVKTESADEATFEGTVSMLDYMKLEPMVLHLRIHQRSCTDKGRLVILTEVSPRPDADPIWKTLSTLTNGFRCSK